MNTGKMQADDISDAGRDVLLVAIEMSLKSWRLALAPAGAIRHRQVVVEAGNYLQVHETVRAARERFNLPAQCAVIFCYEAGREGFHPARVLNEAGGRTWIVDSSSIEVERRQRRAKCDALDASKLHGLLQRQVRGERVFHLVRLPSRAQEDERQRSREREELRVERARLRVRMQSLLFTQGVRDFPKSVAAIEHWMSQHAQALPPQLAQRLGRELQRLRLVTQQLNHLDQQQRQYCASPAASRTPAERAAAQLCQLKGIASRSASILAMEMFGWRQFHNRREVGALAGLVSTPYDSGESRREQGISKAGNKRVRRVIVELAWQWVRYQPHSALTQWFVHRFGGQGKRSRRLGIVALARRLLVALWHYLQHDALPQAAQLKA